MIEVSVLVDKLNGMTCDEIYEYLKLQGVQGEVQSETSCVLAQWLRRESGVDVAVGVHQQVYGHARFGVVVYEGENFFLNGTYGDFYQLDPGPQAFIGAFDNEMFPELVVPYEDYD